MTIRFTCAECGSVLKINDELAGTAARCPKCKTKFVVPAAAPEKRPHADESAEAQMTPSEQKLTADLSESPTVATVGPVKGATADSESELSAVQLIAAAAPSEAPAATSEPLSLEDSDDEIDAVSSVPVENEAQHGAAGKAAVGTDDDDDLDSPPVFVSSLTPISKQKADASESASDGKRRTSSENAAKSRKSGSASTNEEAFDPMKFLMTDTPGQVRNSFPTNVQDDSDLSLSSDSDDDQSDRATPQSSTKRASASANTRAAPEKVDLATAAKMMKKAIKDSQSDAAHQREANAEGGYDYFLFIREAGVRGVAVMVAMPVLIVLCMFVGKYVFGSNLKLPKLGYVSGTVKLDGHPLQGALVYYAPVDFKMDGGKRDRARTSIGVTDEKGFFKMMYVDKIEGVAVGKCYVSVTHIGEKGNDVPPEWMAGALVTKEVAAGKQTAPADINMESKKDPRKN